MRTIRLLLIMLIGVLPAVTWGADGRSTSGLIRQARGNLGKNVRLDFKAVPLEEGDKGVYVITATPNYNTGVNIRGEDGSLAFSVSGSVQLLDKDIILVRYAARTVVSDENGEAEYEVASGVMLEPGQEIAVSGMGGKTFVIRASFVEQ
jgi:hypothetical protein